MITNDKTIIWEKIIIDNASDPMALMEIFYQIQEQCGCVTEECLSYVSEKMGLDEDYVRLVGRYYTYFSSNTLGRYTLEFCGGLGCHLKSSADAQRAVRTYLKLADGMETTPDGLFTIRNTGQCLGLCGQGPVLKINGIVCTKMTSLRTLLLVKAIQRMTADDSLMDIIRQVYEEYEKEVSPDEI